MCTTKYDVTHTHSILFLFFKEQSCAYLVELLPLMPAAEFCASLTNNSTTFSIFKFGTFHGNQHFHPCLVKSWPLFGIDRFPAGLLTYLIRWPKVNCLRASGNIWFRTIIMNVIKRCQHLLHCLSQQDAELWNVVSPACKWTAGNY